MTLTPELIAKGWKPIGEIVNCPVGSFFQIMNIFPNFTDFHNIKTLTEESQRRWIDFSKDEGSYVTSYFRPLIPLTPDTIVLSREDALYIHNLIYQYDPELTTSEVAILEQLNPDIQKLRELLGSQLEK